MRLYKTLVGVEFTYCAPLFHYGSSKEEVRALSICGDLSQQHRAAREKRPPGNLLAQTVLPVVMSGGRGHSTLSAGAPECEAFGCSGTRGLAISLQMPQSYPNGHSPVGGRGDWHTPSSLFLSAPPHAPVGCVHKGFLATQVQLPDISHVSPCNPHVCGGHRTGLII